jgi:hypothetical protein
MVSVWKISIQIVPGVSNPTFRRKSLRFFFQRLMPSSLFTRLSRCERMVTANVTGPYEERHKRCFSRFRKQIKLLTMKTFIRSLLLVALVSTLAPSVLAESTPFTVPDGGSTVAMLAPGARWPRISSQIPPLVSRSGLSAGQIRSTVGQFHGGACPPVKYFESPAFSREKLSPS